MEEHSNWNEFYPDAQEKILHDTIKTIGKYTRRTVYVDADHAHDLVTRLSVTGIIAMINNTPICWVWKQQKAAVSLPHLSYPTPISIRFLKG